MIDIILQNAFGSPAVLAMMAALLALSFVSFLSRPKRSLDVPVYHLSKDGSKEEGYSTITGLLAAAVPKFKNSIFEMKGAWNDLVIIPPKWVEGLKSLPENQLSFLENNSDRFHSKYTYMENGDPPEDNTVIKSVKNNLTGYLSKVMVDLDDEISYAFEKEVPACEDWIEVTPAYNALRIVALASGRVFVGPELNRNEDFLKCTIMFAVHVFLAGEAIKKYPAILRPLAQWWIPEIRKCREALGIMKTLMEPVLKERIEADRDGKERPDNMVTWNMDNAPPGKAVDVAYQSHLQILVSMAAIHTTTMTSSHAWFDLAAHPEYLEPLRQEINAVVATEPEGVLSKTSMPKLKKLDSFIKESQRMNPLSQVSFDRKVMSDLTLPDGTVLPRGTYIGTANSEIMRDPNLWDNPEEFDGLRFYKLRQIPGNENKYQFVTTGIDSMQFGHGRHACPGRFFAANELKLILVHLIMNYDIKLPEGESRPKNIETGSGCRPDETKKILLKRRS